MLFLLSLLKTSLEVGIVLVINKWMLTPKTHRMVQGGLDFPLSFLCLRETWSLGKLSHAFRLFRGRQIILHPVFAIACLKWLINVA